MLETRRPCAQHRCGLGGHGTRLGLRLAQLLGGSVLTGKLDQALLAADLGTAFAIGATTPAQYKSQAESLLKELRNAQCPDGGFALWPGRCSTPCAPRPS